MWNRANNIGAAAAEAGSPGANIARAQQSRWTGLPNEAIMRLVEDKIGSMLEGISGATERPKWLKLVSRVTIGRMALGR